jgi:hypothetical protein
LRILYLIKLFLLALVITILTTDSLAPIGKLLIMNNASRMPLNDLACYWAAFHALIDGKNPYDVAVITNYLKGSGFQSLPILMLPFSFFIFSPVLVSSLHSSIAIWFLLSIASLMIVPYLAWKSEKRNGNYNPIFALIGLTFFPAMQVFFFGQFGLILASILGVGWLCFIREKDLCAGMLFSFCFFKPGATIIALLALVTWTIRSGRPRILIGLLITQVSALLICYLICPYSLKWWLEGTIISPLDIATASLTTTARYLSLEILNYDWRYSSIVITAIGCGIAILSGFFASVDRLESPRVLSTAFTFSFALSPYVWIFDQAILLLPYCMLWGRVINSEKFSYMSIAILLLVNSGVFLIFREYDYQAFWFAPSFLIGSELVLKMTKSV